MTDVRISTVSRLRAHAVRGAALALLALGLGACASIPMKPPAPLDTTGTAIPVVGALSLFNDTLTVGPYAVKGPRSTTTTSATAGVGDFRFQVKELEFEYAIARDGQPLWNGACTSKKMAIGGQQAHGGGTLTVLVPIGDRVAECTLSRDDTSWQVALKLQDEGFAGATVHGDTTYRIQPTRTLADGTDKRFGPAGYHVLVGDALVGAIDVTDKAVLWVDPNRPVEQQNVVAAVSMGMLILTQQNR